MRGCHTALRTGSGRLQLGDWPRAGCTAHEIGAITGHASLTELVRYTRAADQRRLAEAAMTKTRTSSGKPHDEFANKAGKLLEIKVTK